MEKKQLRLRIYKLDKGKIVGEDILHRNVFLHPQKKGWFKVDIRDENLILPSQGFVMAVEWIRNQPEIAFKVTQEGGKKSTDGQYGVGVDGHRLSENEKKIYSTIRLISPSDG